MEGLLSQRKGLPGAVPYGSVPSSSSSSSPLHSVAADDSHSPSDLPMMTGQGLSSAERGQYKAHGQRLMGDGKKRDSQGGGADPSREQSAHVRDPGSLSIKSGRQRKKSAARSAGEFKAKGMRKDHIL